jgi:hypothetical protein
VPCNTSPCPLWTIAEAWALGSDLEPAEAGVHHSELAQRRRGDRRVGGRPQRRPVHGHGLGVPDQEKQPRPACP